VSAPVSTRGVLHPYEVDLLCVHAEVEPPFPLEIPSTGTSEAERSVVFQGARESLELRGLADANGPAGIADELVRLLRHRTGALDLVVFGESGALRATLLVGPAPHALLAVQRDGDEEGAVRLRSVPVDRSADALVALVPDVDAASASPFALPVRALRAAEEVIADRVAAGEPVREDDLLDLLERGGLNDRATRRMIACLQPVQGQGQLGGSRPNGLRGDDEDHVRFGAELAWVDTPRGRFRLAEEPGADGSGWISVNPLGREDLRAEARRLLGPLRRDG
jgi:hypothetical protein